MTLARKIQKYRKMRGLTQEELAEALGVSHQSISKWESAQATPGLDKVLLLSEYFQVSTDALLKAGEEPRPVTAAPAPSPMATNQAFAATEPASAVTAVTPIPHGPESSACTTPEAPAHYGTERLALGGQELPDHHRAERLARREPEWLLRLGALLAVAGLLGLGALWFLSLLHPPYTLGKTLGPLDMFLFYIRYNEFEPFLTLACGTALAGAGLFLLHRLRRKPAA